MKRYNSRLPYLIVEKYNSRLPYLRSLCFLMIVIIIISKTKKNLKEHDSNNIDDSMR